MTAATKNLLRTIDSLPDQELHELTQEVLRKNAQRHSEALSTPESELLSSINEPVPAEMARRYQQLIGKRDEQTLTSEEHQELCRLNDSIEERNVQRLTMVAELARRRGRTLREMADQLSLRPLVNEP